MPSPIARNTLSRRVGAFRSVKGGDVEQTERDQRAGEGQRVEVERGGDAEAGDHQTRERRSKDAAEILRHGIECDGLRQHIARHQFTDEGLAQWTVERVDEAETDGQDVDVPDGDVAGRGERAERPAPGWRQGSG